MSKYSEFKEWSKTQAPNKSALFASTVDQDGSWAEMNADMNAGVATPQIVSDATVAIAYADYCTAPLIAKIAELEPTKTWQPIDKAPKNGLVLLLRTAYGVHSAYFSDEYQDWVSSSSDNVRIIEPIWWMFVLPLPTQPKGDAP